MDWQKQDGESEVEDERKAPHDRSRRALFGTIGGFALAASGLMLPDWLDETEAREGALDGDRGGRRGKNRRGRDRRKKRTHGDKKDRDKGDAPRGAEPLFRSTALAVYNNVYFGPPLQCTFFYRLKTGLDDYALPKADGSRSVLYDQPHRYDPDHYRVGVLIKGVLDGDDIYADVRNVSFWYPRGSVTRGRNLDPASGNFGTPLIAERNYFDGEGPRRQNIQLQRLNDDSNGVKRIEWRLYIHT